MEEAKRLPARARVSREDAREEARQLPASRRLPAKDTAIGKVRQAVGKAVDGGKVPSEAAKGSQPRFDSGRPAKMSTGYVPLFFRWQGACPATNAV